MKLLFILSMTVFIIGCSSNSKKPQQVLLSEKADIRLEIDKLLNTPILIKGNLSALDLLEAKDVAESALLFIEQNKVEFKLKTPREELSLAKKTTDDLGSRHVTFNRQVNGVPIWGDELKVHFDKNGTLYFINGRYHPSLPDSFNTKPVLKQADAEQVAVTDAKKNINASTVKQTELLVYPHNSAYYLVYRINIVGGILDAKNREYFIDAQTGEIIHKYDNIQN